MLPWYPCRGFGYLDFGLFWWWISLEIFGDLFTWFQSISLQCESKYMVPPGEHMLNLHGGDGGINFSIVYCRTTPRIPHLAFTLFWSSHRDTFLCNVAIPLLIGGSLTIAMVNGHRVWIWGVSWIFFIAARRIHIVLRLTLTEMLYSCLNPFDSKPSLRKKNHWDFT